MDFNNKLPRTKKEDLFFMLVVTFISVNLIGALNSGFEAGFSLGVYMHFLTMMPIMWIIVIACIAVVHPIADKVSKSFLDENDSFKATITVNILFNVIGMSFLMTIFGTWVGSGQVGFIPVAEFISKWPRSLAIAYAVEGFIAQPFARFILFKLHQAQDKNVLINEDTELIED